MGPTAARREEVRERVVPRAAPRASWGPARDRRERKRPSGRPERLLGAGFQDRPEREAATAVTDSSTRAPAGVATAHGARSM